MRCLGEKPNIAHGIEKKARKVEVEMSSNGVSCPHYMKPPIKLPAKTDIYLQVNKLIYGDTGTNQSLQTLQEVPTSSSSNPGRETVELKPQLSTSKFLSADTNKDKMQQRQKTLSRQLHAQAKINRAATQLPMWLQPRSGQPLSEKVFLLVLQHNVRL